MARPSGPRVGGEMSRGAAETREVAPRKVRRVAVNFILQIGFFLSWVVVR